MCVALPEPVTIMREYSWAHICIHIKLKDQIGPSARHARISREISSLSLRSVYCYFLLHTRIHLSWYFYVLCVYMLQQTITWKFSVARLASVCVSYESSREHCGKGTREMRDCARRVCCALYFTQLRKRIGPEENGKEHVRFSKQNVACFIAFYNFNEWMVVKWKLWQHSAKPSAELKRINRALFLKHNFIKKNKQ